MYNIHFQTFYLSIKKPNINISKTIYPTYTNIYNQLHKIYSYLTQHTLTIFIIKNKNSINFISIITNILKIPTLTYLKNSKTIYQKIILTFYNILTIILFI